MYIALVRAKLKNCEQYMHGYINLKNNKKIDKKIKLSGTHYFKNNKLFYKYNDTKIVIAHSKYNYNINELIEDNIIIDKIYRIE